MRGSFNLKGVASHRLRISGLDGVQGDCNHSLSVHGQHTVSMHGHSTEDREDTQLQIRALRCKTHLLLRRNVTGFPVYSAD